MSSGPFLARLSDAIQSQHEATMRLQELASELIDHCARMRQFTDRLHVIQELIEPPQDETANVMDMARMPAVLRGGPRER